MILRRLTEQLKQQNWTAIAIEFVLLVAGVFLGIQVANWNETRREHALEAEYIARLQRDFGAIDARLLDHVGVVWIEENVELGLVQVAVVFDAGGSFNPVGVVQQYAEIADAPDAGF